MRITIRQTIGLIGASRLVCSAPTRISTSNSIDAAALYAACWIAVTPDCRRVEARSAVRIAAQLSRLADRARPTQQLLSRRSCRLRAHCADCTTMLYGQKWTSM